jgi:hypothetical protein
VTPEEFSQRIQEIVLTKSPKTTISTMLGFHGKSEPHCIEEYKGQLRFVAQWKNTLLKCGAPRWSFTVFFPEDGNHPFMPRASITVHPKTVAANGEQFAQQMGSLLLKSISERLALVAREGP